MYNIWYGHDVCTAVDETLGPLTTNQITAEALASFCATHSFTTVDTLLSGQTTDKEQHVLTFDDGYQSNYKTLLPIIEEHQVPIVVFVVTDCIAGESIPTSTISSTWCKPVTLPSPGKKNVYRAPRQEKNKKPIGPSDLP